MSVALVGETETPMLNDAPIKMLAVPDWLRSASEVAVTLTTEGFGAVAGARYRPPDVIWPHAFPLQPAPERLQSTTLFVVPLTVAISCSRPLGLTCGNCGETVTAIDAKATAWSMVTMAKSQYDLKLSFMNYPPRLGSLDPRPAEVPTAICS